MLIPNLGKGISNRSENSRQLVISIFAQPLINDSQLNVGAVYFLWSALCNRADHYIFAL